MRVAVTTTADSAPRLAGRLTAAGLEPVVLPCITIEPTGEATLRGLRNAANGADWIFVTSRRAVRITWPDDDMPDVPVAAVGPSTAATVTSAGGRVELIGEEGAASLARRLAPRVKGAMVVYPSARVANPKPAGILRDAGAEVVTDVAYVTTPTAPADDPVDAAVFGSPSAVEGWGLGRRLGDLGIVAAVGSTTAAALRAQGRPPDIVPDSPALEPIIAALSIAAAERRTG